MINPLGLKMHPPERAEMLAARARQRTIGRELRRIFDDVVREPLPENLRVLLDRIDQQERRKNGPG